MTFNEAKYQQLNAATTYRVYGHAVEFEQEEGEPEGTEVAARKRFILISPCFCVQDSPDNPCTCNHGTLWWLSKGSVIAHDKSARKDEHGKELQFFDVLVDSTIMVESLESVSAGALKGLGNNVTARSVRNLGTGGSYVPPVIGTSPGLLKEILVGIAVDIILNPAVWKRLPYLPY